MEQLRLHPGTASASARFKREQYFPAEWNPQIDEFLSLFHRYDYIYKCFGSDEWKSPTDSRWALDSSQILKAVACAPRKYFIGTRWGRANRYAVLDIDINSKYHNEKQYKRIKKLLRKAGIENSCLYRSSDSGGWHIYIFFDEPVSTRDLQKQFHSLFVLSGYTVAKGQLEIFPTPCDRLNKGFGLRLPLQEGFAWLDEETFEVESDRWEYSPGKAINRFLDDMNSTFNTRHDFHRLRAFVEKLSEEKETSAIRFQPKLAGVVPLIKSKTTQYSSQEAIEEVITVFGFYPPNMIADVWVRGRHYALAGLTRTKQRSDALFCLGHYYFYGDPKSSIPALGYGYEDERERVIKEILDAKHNGMSKDISRGRSDAESQIERAARWVPPHRRGQEIPRYEPKTPIAWTRANVNRRIDARKRIQEAVASFVKEQKRFGIRDLAAAAKCSTDTLYKHPDLWKKAQDQINQKHFAIDPGQYIAGGGVGCSENPPPSTRFSEKMPPGRRAARQIVSEISMRIKRDIRRKEKEKLGITSGINEKWKTHWREIEIMDIERISIFELKAKAALVGSFLMTAPDDELETQVRDYADRLKVELERRLRGPTREDYT